MVWIKTVLSKLWSCYTSWCKQPHIVHWQWIDKSQDTCTDLPSPLKEASGDTCDSDSESKETIILDRDRANAISIPPPRSGQIHPGGTQGMLWVKTEKNNKQPSSGASWRRSQQGFRFCRRCRRWCRHPKFFGIQGVVLDHVWKETFFN